MQNDNQLSSLHKASLLKKKVDVIDKEINKHEKEILKLEDEINVLFIENAGDFTNSYVKYFDGSKYKFLFVEHQCSAVQAEKHALCLDGPMITLYDDPLSGELGEDGTVVGEYDEDGFIVVPGKVLQGLGVGAIKKISKVEMDQVINAWTKSMKTRMKFA